MYKYNLQSYLYIHFARMQLHPSLWLLAAHFLLKWNLFEVGIAVCSLGLVSGLASLAWDIGRGTCRIWRVLFWFLVSVRFAVVPCRTLRMALLGAWGVMYLLRTIRSILDKRKRRREQTELKQIQDHIDILRSAETTIAQEVQALPNPSLHAKIQKIQLFQSIQLLGGTMLHLTNTTMNGLKDNHTESKKVVHDVETLVDEFVRVVRHYQMM